MKRITIRLVAFTLLLTLLSFKSSEDTSVKALKEYVKKMSAAEMPQGGKVYHVHFNIRKEMSQVSKIPSSDTEVKMTMNKKLMVYETPELTIYKDADDVFTVVHPRKEIIWSKAGTNQEARKTGVAGGQLALLEKSTLKSNTETVIDGKTLQVITLLPESEMQKNFKLKQLTFYYNQKVNKLYKVTADYLEGNKAKREETTYHTVSFDHKGKMLPSAKAYVFASQGKLQSLYKAYKVIENRK